MLNALQVTWLEPDRGQTLHRPEEEGQTNLRREDYYVEDDNQLSNTTFKTKYLSCRPPWLDDDVRK